ncbi:MAG: site-2 protease family protein [Acholeplasmataceae bacterium]|nr:site-2 protease family protein [Acholeplasmataceae bacterium]
MKKHVGLYFLIFSFFIGVIFVLLVYSGLWDKFITGMKSISWWAWFLYLVLAFYITLTLHELGHFFAFYFQKIKLRAIYLTIFVFYKTKKGWRFTIKPKLWILFGGLVVPDLEPIEDEKSYDDVSKKFSKALITAPIVTVVVLGVTILTFILSYILSTNPNWIGFITLFTFYVSLLSALYIYTFKLSNEMFYGDFVAYKKMNTDLVFRFVQLNQYLSFGLNKKDHIPFMWEKSRTLIKENNIKRNAFHSALLMTYLEGVIYEGMKPDLDIELKLKKLHVSSYAKVEYGLIAIYDLCLYYYTIGKIDQAYHLLDRIERSQGKKISERIKTYFNKKTKHVMHITYDYEFLENKENYPSEQSWIFEPIMDIYEDMETLHKPLPFKPYLSLVYLEKEDEEIKKSDSSL